MHRFYLVLPTGTRCLAAEGRSSTHAYESAKFTFSPHPEFSEVIPMRSGSSAVAIRKWLQRIIHRPSPSQKRRRHFMQHQPEKTAQKPRQNENATVPSALDWSPPHNRASAVSSAEQAAHGMKKCSQCSKLICTSEVVLAKFVGKCEREYCHMCHRLRKSYSSQV